MHALSHTMSCVEYRDARMQAQADRDERMFDAGHEQGMSEAEHDLAECARKCMIGAPDDNAEKLRYFIARFVGYLDSYNYDKLSTAIRETTGVCKDDDES
jgi:hypothetical protein